MSDSFVAVPDASKEIDTEQQTVNAQVVQRQRVILVPGQDPHGCIPFHLVSAGGGDANNVKAGPGQVYGWRIFNIAADFKPLYVKLHNTAGVPTPGAGVVQTIAVQAGSPEKDFIIVGSAFSVGIGISIVKGIADSDATPVLANECVVDLYVA